MRYTEQKLEEILQESIHAVMQIIQDKEESAGKRINGANALNGLVKTYKMKFIDSDSGRDYERSDLTGKKDF